MPFSPTEIGSALGAIACAAFGVWQNREKERSKTEAQAAKHVAAVAQQKLDTVSSDDLAKKNHEIAEAYKKKAEEWKTTWETEHTESQAYRKLVHDRNELANVEHLKLIEENATLRARTDLTPIIAHIEQQSATNERVSIALTKLTTVIEGLILKLPTPEP